MYRFYMTILYAVGIVCLVGASTSERYIGNAVNEDYPGMCFYKDTQTPIAVEEIYKPTNECVQIRCTEEFALHLKYCDRYQIADGCTVTFNKEAQYPDCCANINCPSRG